MNKHYPTPNVSILFQDFGPAAPHYYCTTCGHHVNDPIHTIEPEYDRLKRLASQPVDETWSEEDWANAYNEFLSYKVKNGYEPYPEEDL